MGTAQPARRRRETFRRCARSWSSPATSATRIDGRAARLPRGRPDGRARSVQREQGLRRAGDGGDAAVVLRRPARRGRIRARRQRHRRRRLGGGPARARSHARGGGSVLPVDDPAARTRCGHGSTCSSRCAAISCSGARSRGGARLRGGMELRSRPRTTRRGRTSWSSGCERRWPRGRRRVSAEDDAARTRRRCCGSTARRRGRELGWRAGAHARRAVDLTGGVVSRAARGSAAARDARLRIEQLLMNTRTRQ